MHDRSTVGARFSLIENGGPEPYPIPRSERLDAHSFQKWWFHRWTSSRTFKLMNWENQGMARALFDMAQTESPVGTLPNDDAELAVMLRIDSRNVSELRKLEFGPLRGWRPCDCDGEIRLMHPVVLEQVQDALDRREARVLSKEDQAHRKRIQRLRDGLRSLSVGAEALADDVLIRRMDDWLSHNWPRSRSADAYRQALIHAEAQRWFSAKPSV